MLFDHLIEEFKALKAKVEAIWEHLGLEAKQEQAKVEETVTAAQTEVKETVDATETKVETVVQAVEAPNGN